MRFNSNFEFLLGCDDTGEGTWSEGALMRRHSLVWLDRPPEADSAKGLEAAAKWFAVGNPFVLCRQKEDTANLAIGFCLAVPGCRPRRFAAAMRHEHIVRFCRPPRLRAVAHLSAFRGLSEASALLDLACAAESEGLDFRVFGSWMWQALTGGGHVREGSDLDLLLDVGGPEQAHSAAEFLSGAMNLPFRLDGEFSILQAGEVNWREFSGVHPLVLLKSFRSIRMVARGELWK